MSESPNDHTSRRDFNMLALAALGGAIAGALPGCDKPANAPATPAKGDKPADVAKGDKAADAASATNDPSILIAADHPHVCRGLNQCKGKGNPATNDCAGQGACATAEAHDCSGSNACKGQGGCSGHPGENTCKGKGGCEVPLAKDKWDKTRKRFEELMTKAGKKFGAAPAAKESKG